MSASRLVCRAAREPHSDGAGVIDRVGDGVPGARIGERVWVWNAAWGRSNGTAAQYVTLPARQAVALPEGTEMEAGACFGIPALTALHAVQSHGGVRGKVVLVAGGAGAVGHYAVQFARLLGARQVLASVSSPQKAELAVQAGADAAIDYRREDMAAQVRSLTGGAGIDRVIEVDIAAQRRARCRVTATRRRGGHLRQRCARIQPAILSADRAQSHPALLHRLPLGRRRPRRGTGHARPAPARAVSDAQHRRAPSALTDRDGARIRRVRARRGQRDPVNSLRVAD